MTVALPTGCVAQERPTLTTNQPLRDPRPAPAPRCRRAPAARQLLTLYRGRAIHRHCERRVILCTGCQLDPTDFVSWVFQIMPNASSSGAVRTHEPISVILDAVVADLKVDQISVGELVARLRRRSYGGLFIALAIVGLVPGFSLLSGPLMIVPALQLLVGLPAPILPGVIQRYEVDVPQLRGLLASVTPRLVYLEKIVRPRWTVLTKVPVPNFLGLLILALAFVFMLPLPFSNFLPALAIILLAMGLIERDGLLIAIGVLISMLAIIVGFIAAITAIAGAEAVLTRYFA